MHGLKSARDRRSSSRQLGLELRELRHCCFAEYVDENAQCVLESVKHLCPQNLLLRKRKQTRIQCEEVPSKITTIHSRDVMRRQGLQSLGVIPVVEMPSVAIERLHGHQRVACALKELSHLNVAEVVCR